VDEKLGAGTYDEHGVFDPNDKDRLDLPWTERELNAVQAMFFKEYNASGVKWTEGTGGGPGRDEDYMIWQERDPLDFCSYSNQHSHLYLTLVYILDKQYGFLLTEEKPPLPPGCRVEDGCNAAAASASASSKKQAKEDEVLSSLKKSMESMSAARALQSKELQSILQGTGIDETSDLIEKIERTTNLVDNYESKTTTLEVRKRSIMEAEGSRSEKKRRLAPVLYELKANDKMIKQLKKTLDMQVTELSKLNGEEESDDDGDLFDGISISSS
jgi:hypothetical protein